MATSSPVVSSPKVAAVLQKLHGESDSQESSYSVLSFWLRKQITAILFGSRGWNSRDDDFMRDKYICLEADKAQLLYLLARSTGALNIVEAGTSFGVSTIYLALAAGQNAAAKASGSATPGQGAQVFATENEPTKAKKARENWKEAGEEVEPWITLLEGDLRETLPEQMKKVDQVDLLLLDIWTPLALPAVKAVLPNLRTGALIVADNTVMARRDYKDLFAFLDDPTNGFKHMTTPFKGGLGVIVYLP
ncbi:O-methyltransferase [Arthroderma uncinatum]|uniref:O-methyltransferase n=1 Tax=Arthroderma uncinatum TaxID=74035 RepID=UPI00144AE9C4|nr:O-methyltransferase [Arthroderma uncinatum]KAF3479473.1 O-methyltransferase [Arthroderma uncinatum]